MENNSISCSICIRLELCLSTPKPKHTQLTYLRLLSPIILFRQNIFLLGFTSILVKLWAYFTKRKFICHKTRALKKKIIMAKIT